MTTTPRGTWRTRGRAAFAGGLTLGLLAAGTAGCGASSDAYDCLGTSIPTEAVTDPRPATELDEIGRRALDGLEVPPIDPAEWTIVSAGQSEVVLLRALPVPDDHGAGDVRTHERMVIEVVDAPNGPGTPWMMTASGTCALVSPVSGAGTATVTLDPARPPDPGSAEVALLVTERACNSGEDAKGRVRVASLRQSDSAVEVVLAVHPRTGAHTCPSNPPTPYVLTLDEPLGARELVDASVAPPRPVALPTEPSSD